ncbi:hypothetical protein [Runella limosa]|uniref:hypothetical protein n=1 Tax=Runella limosa TaxID=370978 RepID=UPI00040BFCAF|nr:hypothetical protein [Runella limosa]
MSTQKLSNISVEELRRFLLKLGLNQSTQSKGRGGHEKWTGKQLTRPIIFQTHIDPVPEFIMKQILRHLGLSKDDFFKLMKK